MTQSKTWTEEEAISKIVEVLEAAKRSPQFVTTNDGRFTVSFQARLSGTYSQAAWIQGHLETDDIGEL